MQTIYYTTTHFVRHTGNVVDLEEYRRKLALTREGNLAPLPEEREEPEAPRLHLVAVQDRRARNSNRAARRAWALDICASMGVLLMTLTFIPSCAGGVRPFWMLPAHFFPHPGKITEIWHGGPAPIWAAPAFLW